MHSRVAVHGLLWPSLFRACWVPFTASFKERGPLDWLNAFGRQSPLGNGGLFGADLPHDAFCQRFSRDKARMDLHFVGRKLILRLLVLAALWNPESV
jgi:hypothetical protein